MGRWRVGTLSMGITLMVLGVILLISLFGGFRIADQLLKAWPVLLILLGGEILYYLYRAKEEQPKIRYDIFSIFMIAVIFLTSTIFYGFASTGILGYLTTWVNSNDYSIALEMMEKPINGNINKIMIQVPNWVTIELKGHSEQKITYRGSGDVFCTSLEAAEEIMKQGDVIMEEIGDILYIHFLSVDRRDDFKQGVTNLQYNLFLPVDVDVEIKGGNYYSKVAVDGEIVRGNWLIDEVSNIQVIGNAKSNFQLESAVDDMYNLKGNIDWEVEEQQDQGFIQYVVGGYQFGEAQHRLNIIGGTVEVINF